MPQARPPPDTWQRSRPGPLTPKHRPDSARLCSLGGLPSTPGGIMPNKNIESVLLEERTFPPPPEFTARAVVKPGDEERMRRVADAGHAQFWADLARRELNWHKPFSVGLDDSRAPNYRWFTDGKLNVS